MKQFLKENIALAFGISLPLVLMVFFFVAGKAATVSVDNPQYDAVFAVNYYENRADPNQPWQIGVDEGKLTILFTPAPNAPNPPYYNKPQIYRFNHRTLRAELIDINFDSIVDGKVSDPDLDALNAKKLNPNPESPDGYRLEYHYRSSGGGIAGELFGFGRYHGSAYAMKKGPRAIMVEGPQPYFQAKFLAWIESNE
ncbi:MAG: hypothetical protein HY370_06470 [Proteobacteria bacterium]|nr:hypothetical protein [Pseudomonadota bacterium]